MGCSGRERRAWVAAGRERAARGVRSPFPRLSSAVQSGPAPGPAQAVLAARFPLAASWRMLSQGAEPQWRGGVRAGRFSGSLSHPSLSLPI